MQSMGSDRPSSDRVIQNEVMWMITPSQLLRLKTKQEQNMIWYFFDTA